MTHSTNIRLILISFLPLLLIACDGGQGDDLDMFISNAAKDINKSVEPLPEVSPYIPLEYNADAALADPFKPRKAQNKASSLQPNANRPKEALEAYPLESLKYVGSMSKGKSKYALVRVPDNSIQQVSVGNYLGSNFGLITAINDSLVEIKEIVQDDATGDWIERNVSINLQEQ